jgi:hypothetical protein
VKTVKCFDDLRAYGINCLTGEACGIGYRILCDLDEKGAALVRKCLGLVPGSVFARGWNNSQGWSVMLPHEMVIPLGIFALLDNGCKEVLATNGELYGVELEEDADKLYQTLMQFGRSHVRRLKYRGTGPGGDRHVHEMSGRVL